MLKNPAAIIVFLLVLESIILYLASRPALKRFFDLLPHIFWIYFLPMVASTLGIIDSQSPIYSQLTNWLLPISLFILLMTVDVPAILKLGPMALGMFITGSIFVGIGMSVAFFLFKPIIGAEFYSGFGALAGSWTGGSANMIAVKESLQTPDHVFLPMVVVDAVLPYLWMAILIAGASWQGRFDAWNHSRKDLLDDLARRVKSIQGQNHTHLWHPAFAVLIVIAGIGGAALAQGLARFFPAIPGVISAFTWIIILVSLIALVLSYSPLKNLERYHSNKIGYFILYFVLTTIGAKANLSQMGSAFILMAAGCVVIFIHAAGLLLACRLFKAPLFLAAAASQANLGGVASAPVVAEVYQKGLAPVGLLLAISGNIFGTYIGLAVGQICRLFSL